MSRRVLSLLLVLVMLLGMCSAYAADGESVTAKGEITAFDPLAQTHYSAGTGTKQDDISLPQTIAATVREVVTVYSAGDGDSTPKVTCEPRDVQTEIPVSWVSEPIYDPAVAGDYIFTAKADGYTLAQGVEWPAVIVTLTAEDTENSAEETMTGGPNDNNTSADSLVSDVSDKLLNLMAVGNASLMTANGAAFRVSANGGASWTDYPNANDLEYAIQLIPSGSQNAIVELLQDVTIVLPEKAELSNKGILYIDGSNRSISLRSSGSNVYQLNITSSGKNGELHIGSKNFGQQTIRVENVKLAPDAMLVAGNTQVILENQDGRIGIHKSDQQRQFGTLEISQGASVEIRDGSIIGGTIDCKGTLKLSGSSTSRLETNKDAVLLRSGATFTMTGGVLQSDMTGVRMQENNSNAVFNMSGGTINGRVTGVYVPRGNTFNMSGGMITGCATGVMVTEDGIINVSGDSYITVNQNQNLDITRGGVLNLTGDLTGMVYVHSHDFVEPLNQVFGKAVPGAKGVENFKLEYEKEPTVPKMFGGTDNNNNLVWRAPFCVSTDGGTTWTPYSKDSDFYKAIADIPDNANAIVELFRDVTAELPLIADGSVGELNISGNKKITLRTATDASVSACKLKFSSSNNFTAINVGTSDKGTEVLRVENIEISASTVKVGENAQFILENPFGKVGLTSGTQPSGAYSGIVIASGGRVEVRAGSIREGTILCGGSLVMSGNSSYITSSDGVHLADNAIFEQSGGTIRSGQVGVNFIGLGATFNMSGGSITGGSTGVNIASNGTFNMAGGMVTGNAMGVTVQRGSTINVSGTANISGNSSKNLDLTKGGTLKLIGAFAGSVQVTDSFNTAGAVFGSTTAGASGANNFRNEVNPALTGAISGGNLIWSSGSGEGGGGEGGGGEGGDSTNSAFRLSLDGGVNWQYYQNENDFFTAVDSIPDNTKTAVVELLRNVKVVSSSDSEELIAGRGRTIVFRSPEGSVYKLEVQKSANRAQAIALGKDKNGYSVFRIQNISVVASTVDLYDGRLEIQEPNSKMDLSTGLLVLGGTVEMTGGHISCGALCYNLGQFTMSDGQLTAKDVNLYRNSTFTMAGGTINGHVTLDGGRLIMSAGKITSSTTGVDITSGTFEMKGGAVTGCTTGVNVKSGGTIIVSGGATIDGNQTANLDLRNGGTLKLSGAFTGKVGVTDSSNAPGAAFGTAENGASGAEHFKNDVNPELTGEINGGKLVWCNAAFRVSTDGGNSWTNYFNDNDFETAIERIPENNQTAIVELLRDVTVKSGSDLSIEGNNRRITLRSGGESAVYTLAAQDTAGNMMNIFFGNSTSTGVGPVICVNDVKIRAARMIIWQGTLVMEQSNSVLDMSVGILLAGDDANIEMKSGSITGDQIINAGGKITMTGGAITGYTIGVELNSNGALIMSGGTIAGVSQSGVSLANGTFTMSAGTISGSKVGVEATNGTVTMSGGSVIGNETGVTVSGSGRINISGSARITDNRSKNLDLTGGGILTLTGKFTGEVGVTSTHDVVDGIFGAAAAGASGANRFFCDGNQNLIGSIRGTDLVWGIPVVKLVDIRGLEERFAQLSEAAAAYSDNTRYAVMINNSTENSTVGISRNIYLDLNGKTVTADYGIRINQGAKLYGFDTSTDGYDASNYGKIIGTITGDVSAVTDTTAQQTVVSKRYLKVSESDGISFHRFDMRPTSVVFNPGEAGMYFKGMFYGDQKIKDSIQEDQGLTFGLYFYFTDEQPNATNTSAHNVDAFVTGRGGTAQSGAGISNIVTVGDSDNEKRTAQKIYVSAYFNFAEAGVVTRNTANSITLTDVVKFAAEEYSQMGSDQKANFNRFWRDFGYLYENEDWAANIPAVD